MSTERDTVARALSWQASPPDSPKATRESFHPPWSRPRSSVARGRDQSPFERGTGSFKDKVLLVTDQMLHQAYKAYKNMTWLQRILAAAALLGLATLGILFLVFSERIFRWLIPIAEKWRDLPAGWLIVWSLAFACAFPPVIGFSTSVTIAGFLYGVGIGWLIVASATILGSLCSFIVSRTILSSYVQRLIAHDRRFAAFALTLRHDGLKLLIMIRLCPLPYSLSNGAMSTVPTVQPLMFALATAASTPKLLIHVFIGRQLAKIAESGGTMDTATKLINYASIAGGAILGLAVGWIIYAKTVARAKQLEAEERAQARRETASHAEDGFSDDPDDNGGHPGGAPDDISLFENATDGLDYRDEFTDDDIDAFRLGNSGDEEQIIGMADKQNTP